MDTTGSVNQMTALEQGVQIVDQLERTIETLTFLSTIAMKTIEEADTEKEGLYLVHKMTEKLGELWESNARLSTSMSNLAGVYFIEQDEATPLVKLNKKEMQ